MSKKTKHIETIAIHSSTIHDSVSIVPPMEPSTNFLHDAEGHQEGDLIYTRYENPNRTQLEQVLADLEGGEGCAAFSSGLAAISSIFQAIDSGKHLILPSDLYHGTRVVIQNYGERWGLEFSFVDMTDESELKEAVRDNTAMIFVETPSNPMLNITDLEMVVKVAKESNLLVCVDNTWPTPLNLNPIEYGAQLVVHSTTKYLGGHSDLLGGAVIAAKKDDFFEKIKGIQRTLGAVPSPRDCWLLSRSIRSFPFRMRGHNDNGLKVAEYLNNHDKVLEVYYPGLPSHPGHEIAKRQMRGFGGMISFLYDGNAKETLQAVAGSTIIKRATSLGGVESLWEHRLSSESKGSATPENLIRFSVGLEHIDDLIDDLALALG